MAPKKGTVNNPKGRPPGPNKITGELRDRIKTFLDGNFETIEKDFKTLEPEKRIALFERYLKFVLPQLQTTDIKLDFDSMTESQLDEIIIRILNKQK
ncbi:MAG: hypothetical protein WCS03_09460 [Bacteroidota bacterium]